MELSMKKYAKLASLGAAAVAMGCLGLFALIAWVATPTMTGGIDGAHAMISYIGVGVPMAAIVAAHLAYARILARYAKEQR